MHTPATTAPNPEEGQAPKTSPRIFRLSQTERDYLRELLQAAGWGDAPELGPGLRTILRQLQAAGVPPDWTNGPRLCLAGTADIPVPVRITPDLREYIDAMRGSVAAASWVREVLCRLPRERALAILIGPRA